MQQFRIGLTIALAIFTACNSGNQSANSKPGADTSAVVPATPAGKIAVSIANRDKDTALVTINFQLNGQTKEKTFEQTILKEISDADLYKVLWDAPNSCYIGVLKANHQPRYYHASVSDKNDLKILWFASPSERIWGYMENTMGLGKVSAGSDMVQQYKKNFQSGNIIGDFIAEIKPDASPDSLELYVEFGGIRKSMFMAVPKGSKGVIQPTGQPDHVYFSFVKDNKAEPMIDLHVENGRLQVKTLKEIK
ncbi:hypothetical protein FHW36_106271 [Chitinophaga polysaccharea]|uniref:Lipoprotein n=1 Tax=Chitinophaga polysaccharea TaxID=1293035 RepID=A0A561PLS1_9BACT|nr:hypothetical protein [Chitinophaga polysaccharea]TWF39047.1 hypothetical protein FHW36_106271 [Chitinophaga polysaccharea]